MNYSPAWLFLWVLVLASNALAFLGRLQGTMDCPTCSQKMERISDGMCGAKVQCTGRINENRLCRNVDVSCPYIRVISYYCQRCGINEHELQEHSPSKHNPKDKAFCSDHQDQIERVAAFNAGSSNSWKNLSSTPSKKPHKLCKSKNKEKENQKKYPLEDFQMLNASSTLGISAKETFHQAELNKWKYIWSTGRLFWVQWNSAVVVQIFSI